MAKLQLPPLPAGHKSESYSKTQDLGSQTAKQVVTIRDSQRDISEQITEIRIVVGVSGSQAFQTANSWAGGLKMSSLLHLATRVYSLPRGHHSHSQSLTSYSINCLPPCHD